MGGEICTVNKCLGSEPKYKSGRSERLIHYEMVGGKCGELSGLQWANAGREGGGGVWSPIDLLVLNIYLIVRTLGE